MTGSALLIIITFTAINDRPDGIDVRIKISPSAQYDSTRSKSPREKFVALPRCSTCHPTGLPFWQKDRDPLGSPDLRDVMVSFSMLAVIS